MILKGLILVVLLISASALYGQEAIPTPRLFDQFGRVSAEDRSARFDGLLVELQNDPNAKGFVFVYCGKTCRYGEVEAHFRGIELKIYGRRFDRSRISVVHGGYRESNEVEIWIQAAGAGAPAAHSTVNIKNVTFTQASKQIIEPYDCCDPIGAQWKKFRPKN